VLDTSRLWHRLADELAPEYPDVRLDHQLVDSMTMKLIEQPTAYDVIVTENLFGDILSDLAASVSGGIGLAPSASLGDGGPGIFEPIHGTAPDIAGPGRANPVAMILTGAMLLRELGETAAADAIESATRQVLEDGPRTPDLGGASTTDEVADAVLTTLRATASTTR
jgi:3-isopropylmalate dehydrogenase